MLKEVAIWCCRDWSQWQHRHSSTCGEHNKSTSRTKKHLLNVIKNAGMQARNILANLARTQSGPTYISACYNAQIHEQPSSCL